MSLPGQPPPWAPPGFASPAPRKRKKRRRGSITLLHNNSQGSAGGRLDLPAIGLIAGQSQQEVAAEWPARLGRPETYDHPLAVAARIGRRNYGATVADLPDPEDPLQVRAFEVARDRARSVRWGWKRQRWADAAGCDNRSARRHRRRLATI